MFIKLMQPKCITFVVILTILLHILLVFLLMLSFYIVLNQYPNMIAPSTDMCKMISSPDNIRVWMNGSYHALILVTFIFIASSALCTADNTNACSSRLTRTIIAGIFISFRIFFIPLFKLMDKRVFHWVICISHVLACVAVLSDYWHGPKQQTQQPQDTHDTHTYLTKTYHTKVTSVSTKTSSTSVADESQGLIHSLDDVINNGFTGKHIPPRLAKRMFTFWTKEYLTLQHKIRDAMDRTIDDKVKLFVPQPKSKKKT
eukprot:261147_1